MLRIKESNREFQSAPIIPNNIPPPPPPGLMLRALGSVTDLQRPLVLLPACLSFCASFSLEEEEAGGGPHLPGQRCRQSPPPPPAWGHSPAPHGPPLGLCMNPHSHQMIAQSRPQGPRGLSEVAQESPRFSHNPLAGLKPAKSSPAGPP